ncbi:hypothetical protein R3P38DRAFT_2769441 [Favolaschia claudopus]|uniref:Uncharacterized protein n=1 Tax=Favolaschia claudopus TaxID=2862362 RepID=A0AAW0CJ16_9AGAR
MAGGYGVYKTTEWVRHRNSLVISPLRHHDPPKPTIVQPIELPPPLTEKQKRKKRRVDKFRNGGFGPPQRLFAGYLNGFGRRWGAARRAMGEKGRKKATTELAAKEREKKDRELTLDDVPTHPNWPDDDFPWRLQEERRVQLQKQDRELRMRYIEEFFAGDTDDEELEDAVERSYMEREPVAPWFMIHHFSAFWEHRKQSVGDDVLGTFCAEALQDIRASLLTALAINNI